MKTLRQADALVIVFLALTSFVYFAVAGITASAVLLLLGNALISLLIVAAGRAYARRHSPLLDIARIFYPVVMILVVYKEVHLVIQTMGRPDYDPLFIQIDRWLFGTDPTVWISQFAHPVLTEIMQLAYTSYYFIVLFMGVEIYRRDPHGVFPDVVFTVTYGFFLSYIGYMLLPGVGPRFTLHDFASTDVELPGLWLTEVLRKAINAGESIPPGAADPLALAQRDVFPSGHTQITLVTMYLAYRYRLRSRYVITALGCLLFISTVYLRYHYVIDLAAGALFAALTVRTAPALSGWWERRTGTAPPRT